MRALCLAAAIALSGCAVTAQGLPPKIEQIAGSPSMICSAVLQQQARDLSALKAVLAQP